MKIPAVGGGQESLFPAFEIEDADSQMLVVRSAHEGDFITPVGDVGIEVPIVTFCEAAALSVFQHHHVFVAIDLFHKHHPTGRVGNLISEFHWSLVFLVRTSKVFTGASPSS